MKLMIRKCKECMQRLGKPIKVRGTYSYAVTFILGFIAILGIMFCYDIATTPVSANPTGGQVESGGATITTPAPNTVQINQTTDKAIINWQSFNIGAGERTQFVQPNSSSIALNRINSAQGASQIFGSLTSNGQIILVNQAGIYFASGSHIDVGGIIVSTSDISSQNFLAGKYVFDQPSPYSGSIINEGVIIASQNGLVALLATGVSNKGLIKAELGSVILASGSQFTITFAGNQLISFTVDGSAMSAGVDQNGVALKNGVSNSGQIIANGGKILITAKTASTTLDNAINMTGVAQAQSVSEHNGEIIFSANTGVVRVAAKIDVSGKNKGETGGKVKITAPYILIDTPTIIDASGYAGGGEILIGGNYQGKGPLPNSIATVIAPGTELNADAITYGNGGIIIAWADDVTKAYGKISARGGALSGDGGFVETSGKEFLDVGDILVDVSAPFGKTGIWLLDPQNVTISSGATTGGTFSGANPNIFTPTANSAVVNVATLVTNLGTANVTVNTGATGAQVGDITVANAITWASTNTLSLIAARNIIINAGISGVNGRLSLTAVNAASSITTGASGTINVGTFNLLQGQWRQVGTLPAFTATNFMLNSGTIPVATVSFIRATSGTGTVGTPYVITDVYGLQGIGSNATTLANSFTLGAHIDATSTINWNSGVGFIPIGGTSLYTGTFDGGSKIINGLYENQTVAAAINMGLFSQIDSGGTIKNVGLTNVNIIATNAHNSNFGALAGITTGTASINNSFSTGKITVTGVGPAGDQVIIGGLVGTLFPGTVTNSYSSVSVNAIAAANSIVFDLGGLIGRDLSTSNISSNYSTGSVTLTEGGFTGLTKAIGGFEGLHAGSGTLSNNYWDSQTGPSVVTNAVGTPQTTAQLQAALPTGFGAPWSIIAGYSYPYLNSFYTSTPRAISGTSTAAVNTVVTMATGGTNLASSGLSMGTTLTGTNGYYYFLEGNGIIADASTILTYLPASGGSAVTLAPTAGGSITGLNLNANQINVGDNNINTISNTNLGTAAGALGTGVALYSVSGANLTINNNINFQTTANTTYSINGTITGTGTSTLLFGGPVSISGASVTTAAAQTYSGAVTLLTSVALNGTALSLQSIIGGGNGLTINNSGSSSIAGIFSGTSSTLTKQGSGTLTLSAANTYTGATTISAGTLSIANNNALGGITSGTSIANGATLDIGPSLTVAEDLTFNGGTLSSNSNTVSVLTGNISLNTNDTIMAINNGGIELLGTISGARGFTKNGTGNLRLDSALTMNNYDGVTILNAGTLEIGGNGSLGSAVGGTVLNGGLLWFNGSDGSAESFTVNSGGAIKSSFTFLSGDFLLNSNLSFEVSSFTGLTGTITGVGGLTKTGSGILNITGSGTNTYTGVNTVSAGTLRASKASALGATSSGTNVSSGAVLQVNATALDAEPITLNTATIQAFGISSLSGPITLGGASTIQNLDNTLSLLSGATINKAGYLLTFDANTGDISAAGIISGAGGLTKSGSGTLTLSGNNTYGDTTIISSGTLSLGSIGALGNTTSTTVATGAALDISFNSGILTNTNVINLNGTGVSGAGALTMTGNSDTLNNPIVLQSSSTIGGTGTGALVLGGAITGTNTNLTINLVNAGLSLPTTTLTTSGNLLATVNGALVLNGLITTAAAGNSIILSGTSFTNNAGASALNPGAGNFLVWSGNPASDSRGGIAYNFKQYNATYGSTAVQGTGNGFLYTIAPTITPALTGTISKVYTGTTAATLAGSNYTSSGNIDGDTVTVSHPVSGTYASPNVGTNINIAVSGITIVSATNGSATVYGYQITPTANANVGTITTAPLTITANNTSKTYGQTKTFAGTEFTPTGLQNSETVGSTTLTSSGAINTANVSGSPYSIVASAATGGTFNPANYSITYTNGVLTVNPASLNVTANNTSKSYGQTTTFNGTEFTSTGLQNSETIGNTTLTSSGAVNTADVGNSPYSIIASNATGGTFNPANYSITYTNGVLTVNPASLNVTATNTSKSYGQVTTFNGTQFTSTGLQNSETIGSTTLTSSGAINTANVSGSPYSIVASAATGGTFNPANYSITYTNGVLTVNPASLNVTANNTSKSYGQTTTFNGTEFTSTGLQNSETIGTTTLTSSGSINTANVGSSPYSIIASNAAGGTFNPANYSITYTNGVLTVNPASLNVTANNTSKSYGQTTTFNGTEFTSTGLQNSETIGNTTLTSSGAINTANVSGSPYSIVASAATGGTFNPANYSITYTNGVLTVNPASLNVTANNTSKSYGQTTTFNGTQFTSTGLQNSETVGSTTLTSSGAVSTANVSGSPYSIVASAATGGTFNPANYSITYTNGVLTVNPASLNVTANNTSKSYGQTTTFNGTQFTSTGLQNSETIGSTTLTSGGAASTANVSGSPYSIVASAATGGTFNPANYSITYTNGVLTVNPASLNVTANNTSKSYGQVTTFNGTEFTSTGLQNSETIGTTTLTSSGAVNTADVGSSPYSIIASNAAGGTFNPANYSITYTNGVLTVNPASLNVTANNTSKSYGQTTTFNGTEFTSTGLQNSETIGNTTLTSSGSINTANVGSSPYSIIASNAIGGTFNPANYSITYTNGVLTVNPASLNVTATNTSKSYGQVTTFNGTEFTSTGLQNSETIGNATLTSSGAVNTANVGSSPYSIIASNAIGGTFNPANYSITYTNGVLTVNPASLNVTANNTSKSYGQTTTFNGTEFTSTGLQNNETIGSTTLTSSGAINTANVDGNPYDIVLSDAAGGTFNPSNYSINYTNGLLTVNPAGLVYTANSTTRPFGEANPALSGTVTGFVLGQSQATATTGTMEFTTAATPATSVGDYSITVSGLSANNGNYTFTQAASNATALTISGAAVIPTTVPNVTTAKQPIADILSPYGNTDTSIPSGGVPPAVSITVVREGTVGLTGVTFEGAGVVGSTGTAGMAATGSAGASGAATGVAVGSEAASIPASLIVTEPTFKPIVEPKVFALGNIVTITKQKIADFANQLLRSQSYNNLLIAFILIISLMLLFKQRATLSLTFRIRTALNSMIGFSNFFNSGKSGHVTVQEKEYLQEILYGTQRITNELDKIEIMETTNMIIPNEQMYFTLRTALMDINGYVRLLNHLKDQTTLQQKVCLHGISAGSNKIMQLISV